MVGKYQGFPDWTPGDIVAGKPAREEGPFLSTCDRTETA